MAVTNDTSTRTGDGPTTEHHELRGVWLRGRDPKHLVLSDGSLLRLMPEATSEGRAGWQREGVERGRNEPLTVPQAREIAGEEFSHYVEVRTRAEAQWLRELGQWCGREAERLERELRTGAN